MSKDLRDLPKGNIIEDPPKEKVFCINCKHSEAESEALAWSGCVHPDNLKDNWYKPKGTQNLKPSHLNRGNDCGWYEEKKQIRGHGVFRG